jgi:hypothetical protein
MRDTIQTFFDVISAPQHPQNAAMYQPPQLTCLMNSAPTTILQNTGRIASGAGLGKDRPLSDRNLRFQCLSAWTSALPRSR